MTPSTPSGFATDAELLEAYRTARWTIQTAPDPVVWGLADPVPDPQLHSSGIVTAYNPASIPAPRAQNEAADAELLRHVRALGVPYRRAVARGSGPDESRWEEPGYLLTGEVRPLLVELGLVFGQNAVVWIDPGGEASLVCTRAGFGDRRPGERLDV